MFQRTVLSMIMLGIFGTSYAEDFQVLKQITDRPTQLQSEQYPQYYYVPSTLETITWGYLPNKDAKPVLSVPSGSVVTFDTVSHEGLLEDQGRDAEKYFKSKGVKDKYILDEAKKITQSKLKHDFHRDGPHIVTGPIEVQGAQPGDILKVEVIKVEPRVPYGVISNRHGKGALVGEFPKRTQQADASAQHPERYGNVSIFTPIEKNATGEYEGVLKTSSGKAIRFPLNPFMGIMGVAANTSAPVHSVPPAMYGGNIDINELGAGSTVYYPIQVPGALFYTGDSHFAQGDGEVALTALEASARATVKLTLLKTGRDHIPGKQVQQPLAENAEFWITPGLDPDLDEAMKKSTREAIRFLNQEYGIDEEIAYAYLSAATDFEVSQVVDKTKGIHAKIRKADFKEFTPNTTP
ncbi:MULTISPECIES: acetamidase/formamidase family protein [unclassified Acinetobacter]|uniref:acetamidase/formamidase family protein n=1 Tax=unclassified Acinetobacter TaxID=196816 RepID=UPI002934A4C9|nr:MULTISPECIES: acetamidase/formamidase family protein [unclassified Acinetobacter]WOE32040.1 acetamidase/formamidase family protein [Acinetobacter sp. SAAs470]WOE37509.1 acetamidase/formamidase family protein [Acinetobacter sp. SAAs474]